MPLIGFILFTLILASPTVSLAPTGFIRAEAYTAPITDSVAEPVIEEQIELGAVLQPKRDYLECYCVKWLREFKGVDIRGDASTIKPNSYPVVGGVILLRYKGSAHAAYIERMNEEVFVVSESNYKSCQVSFRTLPYNDPHIFGFYYPQ